MTNVGVSFDPGHSVEATMLALADRWAVGFDAIAHVLNILVLAIEHGIGAAPSWAAIAIAAAFAVLVRRPWLSVFTVVAFGIVTAMGLWQATVSTLALVLVATLVAVGIGIPLGTACALYRPVAVVARPVLDFMQTLPAYVYLIPAVFFFGVGLVPAIVATAIFAIPPAVRMTELGIRQVDPEMVEAAHAFGSTGWRTLTEVQLPLALPSIMAGVNQVIMLSLSMVVISGLVGAAGLGTLVVSAVTQLDVAAGFNSGLAVVILAIYLDRLTAAVGTIGAHRLRRGRG